MHGGIDLLRGLAAMLFMGALLATTACDQDGDFTPDGNETGTQKYGEPCDDESLCVSGLICAGNGTCRYEGEPGTGEEGDDCPSTEFCQWGLVCNHDGVCADGGGGTASAGESCDDSFDCQVALECIEGACYGFQIPLWFGGECANPDEDEGPFRVLFEVPEQGAQLSEFYRQPFPNDARVVEGTFDAAGHPSPGALVPQLGDVVGEVFEVAAADFTGWGNNQAVFMRFSDHVDYDTLLLGDPGTGSAFVIDVTEGAEEFGERASGGFRADSERTNYICDHWIAFHPSDGRPYLPGHTYAAVVTTTVRHRDTGDKVGQDADFAAMLGTQTPGDGRLHVAWQAYQPLRNWVAYAGIDSTTIAGAAVFTVQETPMAPMALRNAVQALNPPVLDNAHLCEDGDAGPFADDDDPTRGCDGAATTHYEIQGTVSLPRFQQGTPPFKDAADGGGLNIGGDGLPAPVAFDDVVYSLTIPRDAEMPEDGWPLVLYGHGTFGNYRSFVTEGLAELLSSVAVGDEDEANFAVLSIDAVMHGPRRFEENWNADWLAVDPNAYGPEVLYFNVINPRAARDNAMQAAADYFQLVRLVENQVWSVMESPFQEAVSFDAEHVYYIGHSQGATSGVGFAAYEPTLDGVVFSGAGGLLIESLLNKTHPYDLPAAAAVALADPELDRWHPVLNVVQMMAEVSDGVNHAPYVLRTPVEGNGPRSVFHLYGIDDQSTPDVTQFALGRAFRIDQVANGNPPLDGLSPAELPLSGNHYVDNVLLTGAVVLFAPGSSGDGHYVLFEVDEAKTMVAGYLGSAVVDGVPTIPEP